MQVKPLNFLFRFYAQPTNVIGFVIEILLINWFLFP